MEPFYPKQLSNSHRKMLFDESAISPEIAAERGYKTIQRRSELQAFPDWQRRLGLLVPSYSPDGKTQRCQLRPNKPRKGRPKYESPQGSSMIIDVHPRMMEAIRDSAPDLFITEGVKCGDALTTRGLCTISISGVWNWQKGGELLPCWQHVALEGRRVFVVFDSDVMTKPEVQIALERLVTALEERGADVRVIYLPDTDDGSKQGVDDYLAAGGTVAELKILARKFAPEDVEQIRLSRDEKLKLTIEDLEHRFRNLECKGMGGHSARDVYLKLIEAAKRYGKAVEEGIRVTKAWGPLAIEAKVSSRTLGKAINRLEEWGLVKRDNEDRKADRAGAFILRASVKHYREKEGNKDSGINREQGEVHGTLHLRAPRLMWPRPKFTPRRGLVSGTRKVRQSPKLKPRDRIERLGKIRGAILDVLDAAGGAATLQEIADALHRKRTRDIRRRSLPMLEEAGIIEVKGDVITLTENWLERLDGVRVLGKEIEADEVARNRYDCKRKAYHSRHKHRADVAPTEAEMDAARERREKRRKEEQTHPVSPLAAAIHDYLSKNPHDACQPPGWLGTTTWVCSLYKGKPSPSESKAAVEELGGERYLRDCLERHRTGASPPPPKNVIEAKAEPEPVFDDWQNHALDCDCFECLSPLPNLVSIGGAA